MRLNVHIYRYLLGNMTACALHAFMHTHSFSLMQASLYYLQFYMHMHIVCTFLYDSYIIFCRFMALKQLSIILIFTILSPLSNARKLSWYGPSARLLSIYNDIECTNNEFRLYPIPGGQANEGMVQRCVSQTWRAVCGGGWSCSETRVLCRQLGFPTSSK